MKTTIIKFRQAILSIKKDKLPITLQNFPHGACGDSCRILAEHLKENGYGTFSYICGRIDEMIHAWLEQNGTIIDITADQFPEIIDSIYIGPYNPWYNKFETDKSYEGGYSILDERSRKELSEVHKLIKMKIKA